jgi:hypothetical protein
MNSAQQRHANEAAYRQLRESISKSYPAGRFVAISEGKIVADAASFEELDSILDRLGKNSRDVLVVQAGVDYPEAVTVFSLESEA